MKPKTLSEIKEEINKRFDELEGIPFHAEVLPDGTCSVDFTETSKFYKSFLSQAITEAVKQAFRAVDVGGDEYLAHEGFLIDWRLGYDKALQQVKDKQKEFLGEEKELCMHGKGKTDYCQPCGRINSIEKSK